MYEVERQEMKKTKVFLKRKQEKRKKTLSD